MLKLWEHPLSPYVQKVKIALYEKKIAFEAEMPNAFTGGMTDYGKLNPRLEVPALVDDGLAIFDSTIILQYLEEKWPNPPMLPAAPTRRERMERNRWWRCGRRSRSCGARSAKSFSCVNMTS